MTADVPFGAATNITGLSFALGANETYTFEFNLKVQNGLSGTPSINYGFSGPGGGSTLVAIVTGNSGSLSTIGSYVLTSLGSFTGNLNNLSSANNWVYIRGTFQTSTSAGTFQLRAQTTDVSNAGEVEAGSYFVARKPTQ